MRTTYRVLYWLNVIGAVVYLLVCDGGLLFGHQFYPGQAMLLGQVGFGIILAILPGAVGHWRHFHFPLLLLLLWEAFILGAVLLGTGMQFYNIPYWDKFLHLFSASMLAGLGLAIFSALTPTSQLLKTKPLLLAIVAVSFGTMMGVLWEFYEFTGDGLLGLNMQRTMAHGVKLLGRAALMDTMGDLCADFLGSLGLAVWCYFGVKRNRAWLASFMFK